MRNENDRLNGPACQVVVQHIKIRRAVFENGMFHLRVCGVDDSGADGFGLALQLKGRVTGGTEVVNGDSVARRDVKPW